MAKRKAAKPLPNPISSVQAALQPPPPPADATLPQTDFVLPVYLSATLAGLAVLIPIPVVDAIIEEIFRRRLVSDISAYNRQPIPPSTASLLNRRSSNLLAGCLLLPFRAIIYLFRDIFRTVLYALTVADATQRVGEYWHRAFLVNYALQKGHLVVGDSEHAAAAAIRQTLRTTTTSPLLQLAQELVARFKGTFARVRTYIPFARRQGEGPRVAAATEEIATAWRNYRGYWLTVARQYDALYDEQRLLIEARRAAAQDAPDSSGASGT